MAPRRGGYYGSSSGSSACQGCNTPIHLQTYGLDYPPTAAAIAFEAIALLGFLILWGWAFKVKKVFRPGKKKGTKFGLLWTIGLLTLSQAFYFGVDIATLTATNLKASFYINYPFNLALAIAADICIVHTIFGFLSIRFHTLNGNTGLAKALPKISIGVVTLLTALGLARLGVYIRYVQLLINSSIYNSDYYINYDLSTIIYAYRGLSLATICVAAATSVAMLAFAIKLVLDQRHGPRSRIPLALIILVTPFYAYRSLSSIIFYVLYSFTYFGRHDVYSLIRQFTYSLPTVPILAGLVWAGCCHDWAYGSPMQAINPDVPYYGVGIEQHQVPSMPAPGYGGYANGYPNGGVGTSVQSGQMYPAQGAPQWGQGQQMQFHSPQQQQVHPAHGVYTPQSPSSNGTLR